uniref:Uncharacterized protein n=1 Tax=Anguilla anguilla TaxID=7936 RepID=A0A0E9VPK6_ANGAN
MTPYKFSRLLYGMAA